MNEAIIYNWNNYLEVQPIWDGTCGYYALKNTLNMMYLLNDIHLYHKSYSFNDLLKNGQYIKRLNNNDMSDEIRKYYMGLNNGHKNTSVDNLKNIATIIDANNNLFFWDIYEERYNLIKLVKERNIGIYGTIIYYEDYFCKHWYGIVYDVMKDVTIIHLLDSYGIIYPHMIIDQMRNTFEFTNIYYDHNYSKLLVNLHKVYQLLLFIVVYFIIIYGIAMLIIRLKHNV